MLETLAIGWCFMVMAYILIASLIERAQRPWRARVTLHVCELCDDGDEGDEDEVEPQPEPAEKKKAEAATMVN